jgi:hypothetical protein
MSACPSEFALDHFQLHDGAGPGVEAHVRGCTHCQNRLAQRCATEREFDDRLAVPFWHAVLDGRRTRRRRRFLWLGLPPSLAVASALLFLVSRNQEPPRRPSIDLVAKGSASLELHCRRGLATFALAPGDAVAPGDELRFVPRATAQGGYVQVGSIDGTGTYTPFYPADSSADSVRLPPPGQPLPGSIRLDRAPGPERLFFVFSPTPIAAATVRQAAQAHVADLSTTKVIQGIRVTTGWVVLPKNIPVLP